MCCLFTILLLLGPRIANIVWWIAAPNRWVGAVGAFNSAIWPILGIIFLPWATLMYVIVAPGGVSGFEWVWVVLGAILDVATWGGGGYGNRDRIPV